MSPHLRVLIVAEADEDVTLILRELRAAGYEPEHRLVRSGVDLPGELRSAPWDVALAVCVDDGSSAVDVLHVVRESGTLVPLIVVSGKATEEAVRCGMRAGAADHITKDDLSKLGPAIAEVVPIGVGRSEGDVAGRLPSVCSAEAETMVAGSCAGMMVVDFSGVVRFANPAAAKMLGIGGPALVGREAPIAVPPDKGSGEATLYDSLGVLTVLEIRPSRIRWRGEASILLTLYDVTDRKRGETQLRESLRDLAYTLSKAMASRDPYTTSHQRRVADLVVLVGARMGLSDGLLWELRLGGLMHDVGKIAVPDEILAKPGKLTTEEHELVRTHAERGYEILRGAGLSPSIPQMALHHHEALDGSGYPRQLTGDSLNTQDRILIACNMVESFSSFRLYRRALSDEDTISKLVSGRGTKYDGTVVDCLVDILKGGEFALGG